MENKTRHPEKNSDTTTRINDDSFPFLIDRMWNVPYNYTQPASFNGLNKFRNLKGASKLFFPPIIQPE